jgi:hypothetical protein
LIDEGGAPDRQRQEVELKIVLAGDSPQERGKSFTRAKAALSRYAAGGEKEVGRLLIDLRCAGCGLEELTAKNVTITLPKEQQLVFDGLLLKGCENLAIKSERDAHDRARGRFSTVAHGLIIDGAKGSLTLEGLDASGLIVRNLGQEQLSMMCFKQCQLRNSKVEDDSSVRVFSAIDCCFGSSFDFSRLSMKEPPTSPAQFRALFGGTIWDANGDVKLHQSFGFDANKAILVELSGEKVPKLLLRPPSEAYLSHVMRSSAALGAASTSASHPDLTQTDEQIYSVSVGGLPVIFTLVKDERKRSLIDQVVLHSGEDPPHNVYKRDPNCPGENAKGLEELLARLRKLRRDESLSYQRARTFETLTDDSAGPEAVLKALL